MRMATNQDNPQAYELLTPLSVAESRAVAKRRRVRNWALLLVLLGVFALFYAISVARLLRG
jgi:hypothetical protein